MKSMWKYLRAYKWESLLGPLFKLLEASFELIVPLAVAAMIDRGIIGRDVSFIWKMGAVLLGLAAVGFTCSVTAQYFAAKAAVGFSAIVRGELYRRAQNMPQTALDELGQSTLITRLTSDVNQVQTGVNLTLRLFLRSPFIVLGAMVMAFTIDTGSALIFAGTIPLLSLIVLGVMRKGMPVYKRARASLDRVLGATRENLTGARVVRAFGAQQREIDAYDRENDDQSALSQRAGRISALMNPATYLIVNAATIALLYVGATRVQAGALSQGQVVALIGYMAQILVELIKLANLIVSVTRALACWSRVERVLGISDERDAPDAQMISVRADAPAIEFENVSFTYGSAGAPALSHVSFTVMQGQTLGVIGGTGSGKSTLVNLIPRFYDATEGAVRVLGYDVQDVTRASLRARVGVVPQKARLFSGTIAENLRWGNENATDEQLMRAVAAAQAQDVVAAKGGLNAMLEQGGANLSGGQRQRLTVARALAGCPEILLLDDSASALDTATDLKLRRAIADLPNHPTTVIVSQRAASVLHADRIIVMDDGRAVGQGTHEELLKTCPVYQEIYYSQFPKEAV